MTIKELQATVDTCTMKLEAIVDKAAGNPDNLTHEDIMNVTQLNILRNSAQTTLDNRKVVK